MKININISNETVNIEIDNGKVVKQIEAIAPTENTKSKICANPDCKKKFIPASNVQKYCSKECGKYIANINYRNKQKEKPESP